MNNSCHKRFWGGAAAPIVCRTMAVALAVLTVSGIVYAQERDQDKREESNSSSSIPSPTTPERITPPAGSSAFLVGHGVGTQGYVCLPKDGAVSWTVNSARPEATLFVHIFGEAVQIITHFLSPVVNPNDIGPKPPRFGDVTWQSSFDSSCVWV